MSLSKLLKEKIYGQKDVRLDVLHQLAQDHGYKQSTAERALRKLSQEGEITRVTNEKGYIVRYEKPLPMCNPWGL